MADGCGMQGRLLNENMDMGGKDCSRFDDYGTGEVVSSSKRTLMEVDNCDLPNKRRVVAHNSQENFSMVGCLPASPRAMNLLCWNC